MKEKIAVADLIIGMFVAELDRPWLDTPFLLQGFLIQSKDEIEELKRLCEFVYVEPDQSTGDAYRPAPTESIEAHRTRATASTDVRTAEGAAEPAHGLGETIRRILLAAFGGAAPTGLGETRKPARAAAGRIQSIDTDEGGQRVRQRSGGISAVELGYLVPEARAQGGSAPWFHADESERAGTSLLATIKSLFGGGARVRARRGEDDAVAAHTPPPVYPDVTTFEAELPKAKEAHEQALFVVDQIIGDIHSNKLIQVRKVQEAVLSMLESVVRNANSLLWLARLKERDPRAYDHGLNVAVFLLCFGRHLGLPKGLLEILGTAGLMQDVGKLKLPQALIEKRAPLTAPERDILKSHVKHSLEILETSPNVSPVLIEIVAQHHERFDGSGYPSRLKGAEMSMLGAVAGSGDTYAAMTGGRSHREPAMPQQVLRQLYEWRGTVFNADLVEKFIQCVGIFPVGSLVELNTKEVAIVMAHSQVRRLKPRLMLILDHNQQPYSAPIVLDLLNDPPTPGGEPYRIVRGLQPDAQNNDLYEKVSAAEAQRQQLGG